MASPVGGAPLVRKIHRPPFLTGSTFSGSWANTSTSWGYATIQSPPTANLTSGGVSMSMNVSAQHLGWLYAGHASAVGQVGFLIPFHLHKGGVHTIAVDWAFSWTAYATGPSAEVRAVVYFSVLDLTNGTAFSSHHSHFPIVVLWSNTSATKSSTGHVGVALHLPMTLAYGHSYAVKTFVQVSIIVYTHAGLNPRYTHPAAAFDMTPPFTGGNLLNYWTH
ncbi:MAG: hypothetical protein L3K19_04770 [Thermoplasmata archaeon]|nr:hypothetical protein [Thermoplasmata archaeon]